MKRNQIAHRARRRQKVRNVAQGLLLLVGMIAVAAALAWLLFGPEALPWIVGIGILLGLLTPQVPTDWLLSMSGATALSRQSAPHAYAVVDDLAERAGLRSTPDLYSMDIPIPNAFTVGRGDDAALAVTDELVRLLDRRELTGVLAHELSHIRNGDTTIMNISQLIGRVVHTLAWVGLWSVLLTGPLTLSLGPAPILVSAALIGLPTLLTVMQMALSRSREFDADLDAAALTGDPEGLARGLLALEKVQGRLWERTTMTGTKRLDPAWLRSHPPTRERVRRLRALPQSG